MVKRSRNNRANYNVVGPKFFEGGKTTQNKTKLIGHPRNVARLRKTQVLQTVAIIEKPRSLSINAIVTARMNLRLTIRVYSLAIGIYIYSLAVQQASKQGPIKKGHLESVCSRSCKQGGLLCQEPLAAKDVHPRVQADLKGASSVAICRPSSGNLIKVMQPPQNEHATPTD